MWFTLAPSDLLEGPALPCRFELDAVIPAAPAQVFAVLSDPSTWPSWYADMKRAAWTAKTPKGVGSTREVELGLLSVREKFVAWQPNRRLAFTVVGATLPLVDKLVEDFVLVPTSVGTTHLSWRVHYAPTWYVRPLHPVLRVVFGHLFTRSLRGLADYARRVAPAPVARAA